jgi:hypothetical protein
MLDNLNISLVLPGHLSPFTDVKKHIGWLRARHESRNKRILSVMKDGQPRDVCEITSAQMSPVGQSGEAGSNPVLERFFALRDCFSRLLYLEASGHLRRQIRGKRIIYSLSS